MRRDLFEKYGEKKLYEGGLSVRTTLDPEGQVWSESWGGLRWVDMLAGDVLSLAADGSVARRHVVASVGRNEPDPIGVAELPRLPGGEVRDDVVGEPKREEQAEPLIPSHATGGSYAASSRFCSKRRRRRWSDPTTARRRIESRSPGTLKNPPLPDSGVSTWK